MVPYKNYSGIPLKNSIIIKEKTKKTGRQFWKDLEVGDILELTYYIKQFGHDEATKVDVLLNGIINHTLTSRMVADMLNGYFQFEIYN